MRNKEINKQCGTSDGADGARGDRRHDTYFVIFVTTFCFFLGGAAGYFFSLSLPLHTLSLSLFGF